MEPPAVTTCSSQASSASGLEKSRRANVDYLQIDPSSTFINNSRGSFEELPENFLETISPQQSTQPGSSMGIINEHAGSPQLAPLAPMSISNEQSYMMNMPGQYGDQMRHSSMDKPSFGNGPAGLLSPLHLESRRHGGSRNEFGSGVYIKEETDVLEQPSHHLLMTQMSQQQEMERISQAETPPAVSNVELASTMIASLIGEQPGSPSPRPYSSGQSTSMLQHRISNIKHDADDALEGHSNGDLIEAEYSKRQQQYQQAKVSARRVYSTKDSDDPLNAEIDDDIYIDTKELCKRIAYELKQHSIPQAIFAERILCRSQGTLSDLLRNPKPWNKLKSGRETFRRMFNWVQQPLSMRLGILDMYKPDGEEGAAAITGVTGTPTGVNGRKPCGMSPPTPAQNVRHGTRRSLADGDQPANKRPRLVFTDIQKRTLQAIFKETQRPSREMQQTIAEHLRLDLSTVANFFMNARRRSRIGPNSDEPQPYQQVRPITPPPDSPPRPGGAGVNGPSRRPPARLLPASMQHVEDTVSSVAEAGLSYGREGQLGGPGGGLDDQMFKLNDPLADGVVGDGVIHHNVYENGGDGVCDSLTPLGDSPVDVVERNVKQEEADGELVAQ